MADANSTATRIKQAFGINDYERNLAKLRFVRDVFENPDMPSNMDSAGLYWVIDDIINELSPDNFNFAFASNEVQS